MKRTLILFMVVILFLSLLLQEVIAAEEASGKHPLDKNCSSCHGTEMYQRSPLFVKSYRQLDAQVTTCVKRNKIEMSEEKTEEVIDFLCDEYYGFE